MTARLTRSGNPPTAAQLRKLKISREVGWYLHSRGIALPTCPPAFKTPEPRDVPGALFDPARVDRMLAAMSKLRHTQGKWAGKPLIPDPWQVAYILAPVYGWVRKDDHGRFVRIIRTEYVDVPRKNGKTTLAGGQAMYLTCADGEPGAQVFAAAASKQQAGYTFAPVKMLAEKSPDITPYVHVTAEKIIHKRTGSYFQVVASIGDLMHGANVHGAVVDELHIHKTRDLVDALETGTGARDQPLVIFITTADEGKPATIYAEKREYCERLARGIIVDPTFYGVIWATTDEDDPFAETTWRKANPGFGISPTRAFLQQEAKKAQESPANLARFMRLHLGRRTKQVTRFIPLDVWDAAADPEWKPGESPTSYGGLDLGATSDMCALCWLFVDERGYHAAWKFWAPQDTLAALDQRTAGQASVWARDKWLILTPGNVTDYEFIRDELKGNLDAYEVEDIGYDSWNSTHLVTELQNDGAPLTPVSQGYPSLNSPMKETLRMLRNGTLKHDGNPVMRWHVDNLAVAMDPAGNVKPDKGNSGDKIDGVSALANAMSRALANVDDVSVYESRDPLVL